MNYEDGDKRVEKNGNSQGILWDSGALNADLMLL